MIMLEDLTRKHIEYTGSLNLRTRAEILIEMAGLRNAIKQAEELLSRCEQILIIAKVKQEESDGQGQEETGREGDQPSPEEASQPSDSLPLVR